MITYEGLDQTKGKNMITALKLNNFRCFSQFEINNIKPITIISGKNNVGKSSVLEALFFIYDHASGSPFLKMNRVRGEIANRTIQNTWESVFYNMNTENPIYIEIEKSGEHHILTYEKERTSLLDFSKDNLNSVQTINLLSNISPYALKMKYRKGDYGEEADYIFVSGAEQSQLANDVVARRDGQLTQIEKLENLTYLSNSNIKDDSQLADLLSKLEIDNRKKELIDIIQIMDEEITDISVLTSNGIFQIYVKKNGLSMPIRYNGDGMLKLIDIVLRILSSPNSVLLIDEIENGLHYSMYERLWTTIAKTAQKANCQVVVTTHSYECIRASMMGIEKAERADDFCYIRLEKRNGLVVPCQYSHTEMKNAMLAELEVR